MNLRTFRLILICIFLNTIISSSFSRDLIKDLESTGKHNTFIKVIENNPLFLPIINNKITSTIFAPTDEAFKIMPEIFINDIRQNNLKVTTKLILSHIFSGDTLNKDTSKQGLALSLDGSIYYTYDIGDLFVKDIVIQGESFMSDNFRVIPVNCIMFLQPSSKDKRLDIKIREKYNLTSCCLQTKKEFNEFYKNINN